MKLSHKDALAILGANVEMTFVEIKVCYRRASAKYHPDRNPAGLEMMKLINSAWQALSDYVAGDLRGDNETEWHDLGDEMNIALNAIIGIGLDIEVCGSWIWVGGDTKPHKEVLKESGYRWAPKKKLWHFRPSDYKSFSRGKLSITDIRIKHGSYSVNNRTQKLVA